MTAMKFLIAAIIAGGFLTLPAGEAAAQSARTSAKAEKSAAAKYRGGPRVRGFVQRRGGYSYAPSDTINTYGNSRSNFGSTNSYRDAMTDRQTRFGPFDHGFFFDSGIAPRGGNSPYPN